MGRGGDCSVIANFDSSSRLLRRKSHEWRGVKLIYCGSILVRIVLKKEDNKTETWQRKVSGIRARYLTLNLFTRGSRFLSVFLQSGGNKRYFHNEDKNSLSSPTDCRHKGQRGILNSD